MERVGRGKEVRGLGDGCWMRCSVEREREREREGKAKIEARTTFVGKVL